MVKIGPSMKQASSHKLCQITENKNNTMTATLTMTKLTKNITYDDYDDHLMTSLPGQPG